MYSIIKILIGLKLVFILVIVSTGNYNEPKARPLLHFTDQAAEITPGKNTEIPVDTELCSLGDLGLYIEL
jgi:hypothetical protein